MAILLVLLLQTTVRAKAVFLFDLPASSHFQWLDFYGLMADQANALLLASLLFKEYAAAFLMTAGSY